MQADIRRKLSMAVRAMDFAQAHPSTDASYQSVVTRLKERLDRADVLAVQEHDGREGERAAHTQRDGLRRTIQQEQLKHLARVAEMAAQAHPELAGLFRYPKPNAPHRTFITAAKAMLAAAEPHKDLFLSMGLGEGFLEQMNQAVTEFDHCTESAHSGQRSHVGARADLAVVADECVQLARLLDGLNRVRFRSDPELLAAWQSASTVVRIRAKAGSEPDAGVTPITPIVPAVPVVPSGNVAAA